MSVEGGAPLKIADAPAVWSATWGADDRSSSRRRRRRTVSGACQPTAAPPSAHAAENESGELQHAFPQMLPGNRILFSILTKAGWQPAALSLDKREWQVLGRGAPAYTPAHLAASGHLIYAQATAVSSPCRSTPRKAS